VKGKEKRGASFVSLLLAIRAGAAVPVQFAVDSELRGVIGGTIMAAAISFLVSTLVLGAAVLLVREGVPADVADEPWWAWI
jgi:transporter family-2 protein